MTGGTTDPPSAIGAPERVPGRWPQIFATAGCVAFLVLVWSAILFHLADRRRTELMQARRDVTNISIALAEQVSRLVENVDQVMRLIQDDYHDNPATFDFGVWVKRATSLAVSAKQVAMFDAQGNLVGARQDLGPSGPRFNIADRGYFKTLAEHPQAGLVVERTVRRVLDGSWVFVLARRLSRPDGSFAGVVLILLDPDYLSHHFDALDVGRAGSVALFGLDGYIRARSPIVPGMYERAAEGSADGLFVALKAAPGGSYVSRSPTDGQTRIYGYRTTAGLPLVVAVGKSVAEVLAPIREERLRALAIGAVATGLIVGGCLVLLRELERRRRGIALLVAAHRALAGAETLFRGVFENATDHLFVHRVAPDGSFSLETLNPSAAALIGLDLAAARGKTPEEVMPPDMAAIVRADIEGVIRSGEPLRRQEERVRGDGSRRFEVIHVPLREPGEDRVGRVFISARDITHLRRAEERIAASEARYRALADALPQLVWATRDADGEAVYVNRQFETYYGAIGTARAARLAGNHPEDAPAMAAAWEAARAEGRGYEVEARLRRQDGTYRWHKLIMVPTREGGRVSGWIGTALDIDDILSARRALAETGDLLSLAQDVAEAGSWDLDMVAGTVRLSPESARQHGLDHPHGVQVPIAVWQSTVLPDDLERSLAEVEAAIAARRTLSVEFRVRGPDGAGRWLQSIGRTYYDAQGRAIRMIGLNLDISERKAAEAALREAKAAADSARLEAEQASAAKTDFLAAMSHEIRTPLNAVIGFTDLIAHADGLAPDLRRHAEFARTAGGALLTVVDDILDFSKVEAGAIALEMRPFSPGALVEDGLSIVRELAARKGLSIHAAIDPALPERLVGDEDRLRQILLNFLNNAVKFTPRGSITVSAAYEGTRPEGERVRFSVADTGIGIPLEKQHRLFERFSQVDNSIARDFGGTGLGLAISKRLIEVMGGAIGVSSEDGNGATFWFSVALPPATPAPALAPVAAVTAPPRTGRILLVEDVELNQELARLVLEAAGHSVAIVAEGAAAVMAVEDGAFDLVLMDVQMPGMDGMTATRLIRRLRVPAARIPVIAMTANVLPDEVRAFREAGMDDHVGKPFNRAVLYATIDRWLARAADARAAGPVDGAQPAETASSGASNVSTAPSAG